MIKCFISEKKPIDSLQWNALCKENGNLLQSVFYDSIQSFYKETPVYFQLTLANELIGGVKLFYWKSEKMKFLFPQLSKSLVQNSEFIYSSTFPLKEIIQQINKLIQQYIFSEGIVSMQVSSYYGNELLLFSTQEHLKKRYQIGIALLNLERSIDEILASFHSKHRNALKKALKNELTFFESTNSNDLLNLMKLTYENQQTHIPNFNFIDHLINKILSSGHGKLYFVKHKDTILSGAFVQQYGKRADYAFGGSIPNNLASGQLLQFRIMEELKKNGVTQYSLGQVSVEMNNFNEKFEQGISRFKIRFGTKIATVQSRFYVFSRVKFTLFQFLKFISIWLKK